MPYSHLEITQKQAVTYLWMNRPEIHNAFNPQLIQELTHAVTACNGDPTIRAIVLGGRGKSFSAGADLHWMRSAVTQNYTENLADSRQLAVMLATLHQSTKPLIARIQGPALGGGTGLTAVCDIAIASEEAYFAMSEVKIGLIPATIGPYVLQAIGARQARRYFLTGERISAETAQRIGLIHEVCPADALDSAVDACLKQLLANGPMAMRAAKKLVLDFTDQPLTPEILENSAVRIAEIRVSAEGQAGLQAFLAKEPAPWLLPPSSTSSNL